MKVRLSEQRFKTLKTQATTGNPFIRVFLYKNPA